MLAALPFTVYLISGPGVRVELDEDHVPPEVVWMPDTDGYACNVLTLRIGPLPARTWVEGVCVADATGRLVLCQQATEPLWVDAGDMVVIPPGGLCARPSHWV